MAITFDNCRPAPISVAQRVERFVAAHKPAAICNKCIATGVGLRNKGQPARHTQLLASGPDFAQKSGVCAICKGNRLVIRRL